MLVYNKQFIIQYARYEHKSYIFIQCQSHTTTLKFVLYRRLISALVSSYHQTLSKKNISSRN
jgi:hypothetical protein